MGRDSADSLSTWVAHALVRAFLHLVALTAEKNQAASSFNDLD